MLSCPSNSRGTPPATVVQSILVAGDRLNFISAIAATLVLEQLVQGPGQGALLCQLFGRVRIHSFVVFLFIYSFTYRASATRRGILLGASYVHLMSDAEEEATIVSSSFGHFIVAVGAYAQAPPRPAQTALTPPLAFVQGSLCRSSSSEYCSTMTTRMAMADTTTSCAWRTTRPTPTSYAVPARRTQVEHKSLTRACAMTGHVHVQGGG